MRQWESEVPKNNLPSFKAMLDFLNKRCQVLKSFENAKILTSRPGENNPIQGKMRKVESPKRAVSSFSKIISYLHLNGDFFKTVT